MSRDRIDVKPDLKAIEKKLRKGLTLRGLVGKIFSPVRKGHNKNKVMMTTEEILKQIESVPRHQITYTRQDGRTNEYTVAITERHADHIIGYKFQNGESCGIRRFNISQIGILEPVT
tara:strand:+ start:102 stop:452 length:351 start_codon:yes stop_codon:yes gene_type:complete